MYFIIWGLNKVAFVGTWKNSLTQNESFPPAVPNISCLNVFGFSKVIVDFTFEQWILNN